MKNCNNCHAPIGFRSVLKSVNPVRITCSNCKARLPIKLLPVLVLIFLVSLVSIAAVVALIPYTEVMLLVLFGIAFAGEYFYYLLLRAGYLE
ncbi:hypothetical protein [uncultured Gilvimarinus sp.]|uniref:hypothetical protein n=1 Tax=uncultured Gilvimarinus sp. TaxID=1689143 RepID=UPI0030D833EB